MGLEKINQFIAQLKSDKQKSGVVLGGIALLIALDFLLVMQLQIRGLKVLDPKVMKVKNDIMRLTADMTRFQAEKTQKATQRTELRSQTKEVVPEEQIVGLLQLISGLAKENSIQILQVDPRADTLMKGKANQGMQRYGSFLIGLEMIGDYHRFGKFLSSIEQLPVFLSVNSLTISAQGQDVVRQKISLVLKTYVTTSAH